MTAQTNRKTTATPQTVGTKSRKKPPVENIVVSRSSKPKKGEGRTKSHAVANFASSLNDERAVGTKVTSQILKKSQSSALNTVDPPFSLEGLGQLMLKNTWNHACIKAIVSNLIGSGWRLIPNKEHIDEVRDIDEQIKEIEDAEESSGEESAELRKLQKILEGYDTTTEKIRKLFKKPNRKMTTVEIAENAFTDRQGIGQGFWEISVNGVTAEPDHIYHVPSVTMKKVKDRDGWLQTTEDGKFVYYKEWGDWGIYDKNSGELCGSFQVDGEGNLQRSGKLAPIEWLEGKEIPISQWANAVLTFYKYNPMDPYYGLPDGIPALPAMAGKEAADEFNYAEFDNYGMARWAVIVNGAQLSPEAQEGIETFFEEDMNENAHGVLIIRVPPPAVPPVPGAPVPTQPTITFERLDTEQHEGHFKDYRHDLRDEVLASHNVPPSLVSIIETGNLGGGTGTTQMQNFIKNVVEPLKTKVEYQINRIIEEGFGVEWLTFTFNTSDLTGELEQARVSEIYSNVYAMTINEIRDQAGLDPVNGGDRIFLVIPGIGLLFIDDLDELDSMLVPGGQPPEKAPIGEPKEPEEPPEGPEEDQDEGDPTLRVLGQVLRAITDGKKNKGRRPVLRKKVSHATVA